MASSGYETVQYTAENFVESAGAVLLRVHTRQICLVHYQEKDEWLLAKGRRNVGESRQTAALREVREETGYKCTLMPVTLSSQAPPAIETVYYPDEHRLHHGACEPFMVTFRYLADGTNVKMIWWFMAAIEEDTPQGSGEGQFEARLFDFEEALSRLTYESDRNVVREAIKIFEKTYSGSDNPHK